MWPAFSAVAASVQHAITTAVAPAKKRNKKPLPRLPNDVFTKIVKAAPPKTRARIAATSKGMKNLTKYARVEADLKLEQETMGRVIYDALKAVDNYRKTKKNHDTNQPYWNTLRNIEKKSKLPPPFSKYLKQAIQEFMKEYPDWRKQYTVAFPTLRDDKIYNVIHKHYMKFRSAGGLGKLGNGLTATEQKKLLNKYTMNLVYYYEK